MVSVGQWSRLGRDLPGVVSGEAAVRPVRQIEELIEECLTRARSPDEDPGLDLAGLAGQEDHAVTQAVGETMRDVLRLDHVFHS